MNKKILFSVLTVAALATGVFSRLDGSRNGQTQNRQVGPSRMMQTALSTPSPISGLQTGNGGNPLQSLPRELKGAAIPFLPVDANGDLKREKRVRNFFDFFLTARDTLTDTEIDALIRQAIASQLGDSNTAIEALALWQQYRQYLEQSQHLPGTVPQDYLQHVDQLQQIIEERALLAVSMLGEWYEPFFGDEVTIQQNDLNRLRTALNGSLSESEKRAQLAELDASASEFLRQQRKQTHSRQADIEALMRIGNNSGASEEEAWSQLIERFDDETAERALAAYSAEQDWRQKYADYAAQKSLISKTALTQEEYDKEVAALRKNAFHNPADRIRAMSLDHE